MNPSGDIALQQRNLMYMSVALMLIIIIPVIFFTLFFAWRYRAANRGAEYDPDWHHSTKLEVMVWSAPLAIIIVLGTITYIYTHRLDPYRPIERIEAGVPVPEGVEPLVVQVVALDWKWLFVYPEYGVASVNELAAPTDRPIAFRITSSSVMNSFFIPALAGQIYAMPGMQTQLHAVINKEGEYKGFSANYSGAGFSGMRFNFLGLSEQGFDNWIQTVRNSNGTLDRASYLQLEQPTENVPVSYYSTVEPTLFDLVLNRCVEPNRMCMRDMMAIDKRGGLGLPGAFTLAKLDDDTRTNLGLGEAMDREYVSALCTVPDPNFPLLEPLNVSSLSSRTVW